MLRYDVCDSSNIIQLITAMVDANDPIADPATIIFDWLISSIALNAKMNAELLRMEKMLSDEQQDELLDMDLETFQSLIEDSLVASGTTQLLRDIGPNDFDEFVAELYQDGYSVSDAVDDIVYEYVDRFVS